MKKLFSICFLLFITISLVKAQTITAAGTVKDEKGNPVSFAFLSDKKYKNATFSDSLGNFKLPIRQDSKLLVKCKGYIDKIVDIGDKTDFQIVLFLIGNESSSNKINESAGIDNEDKLYNGFLQNGAIDKNLSFTEGMTFAAHRKGNLHGSRYLFENWAHGYIIDKSDSLLRYDNLLFNYDKINGGLLITRDEKSVMEVNRDQIKSFALFDGGNKSYIFERVPAIDNSHYIQVLSSGKKYKLYKLISTRFIKSDYINNGFTTHGNDYDEYVDEGTYYLFNVSNNQTQKFLLKKKSLKEVFVADGDKLNKFMTDNSSDIDDAYLNKLGNYMNQ
ncbi:MAG: hypothetical protein JWQ63_82 [Mucilaginibacter sp.]|jgi:hypothetical protein|nr:hypothetical protein [Mucilaginibacter sp.]